MKIAYATPAAMLLAALMLAAPAQAEDFPNKPVKVFVSSNAGGLQDHIARAVANGLKDLWNQPVLVENRPGFGAVAAAEAVISQPADGYALFATDSGTVLTNAVLRPTKISYNIDKDLAPVSVLMASPNILVASPKFQPNTLPELIAYVRAHPGEVNYGSFGIGSQPHIDMEGLADSQGLKMVHVPYTGGAPLAKALLSDEVSFGINGMTSSLPFVKDNRFKAIAFGGAKRSPLLPDLPTIAETVPGFVSTTWFGWWTKAGTPQPVQDKIVAGVSAVLAQPDFATKYLAPFGYELVNAPGPKLTEIFEADKKVLAKRTANLKLNLQ
jgi:tripartite-type tricarboxylate transporter receptor subunit TctC